MLGAAPLYPTDWPLDAATSRVDFTFRHLGVPTIAGRFEEVAGVVRVDTAHLLRRLDVTVRADSVRTGSAALDAQLRALTLFGSDAHPTLRFRSDWAYEKGRGREAVQGLLTMHGQTHVMELIAEAGVLTVDEAGRPWYAATAVATVDHRLWGYGERALTRVGGLVIGHEVHVTLRANALAPDAAPPARL